MQTGGNRQQSGPEKCPLCGSAIEHEGPCCLICGYLLGLRKPTRLWLDIAIRKAIGSVLIASGLGLWALPLIFIDSLGAGASLVFAPLLLIGLIVAPYGVYMLLSRPKRDRRS